MNSFRCVPILLLVLLGAALPAPAVAANWQAYLTEHSVIYEIDADSVSVSDGLVHYKHRNRFAPGAENSAIGRLLGHDAMAAAADHVVDTVADCAGRRQADVTGGAPSLALREDTSVANQVDAACRIAGLATTRGLGPDWQSIPDNKFIDIRSLKLRDDLLFFDYTTIKGSVPDSAVVECAKRRSSLVVGVHYTLQPLAEGTSQARQAEAACRLAHLAIPPGPKPAPVDFGVAIARGDVGDDNLRYDIVRTSIQVRDSLVHFQYTTRLLSDGSMAQEDQAIDAVVDCAGQRRADEVEGAFDLKPVAPATRGAIQLSRVCKIALP